MRALVEEILVNEKQYRIIEDLVENGSSYVEELASRLGERPENIMRDLAELENKGLIFIERRVVEELGLTEEAREALIKGLPEERVYRIMYRCIGRNVKEFLECISRETGLDKNYARIGFQYLVREHCLEISGGKVGIGVEENCFKVVENAGWIKAFLRNIEYRKPLSIDTIRLLKRRKLVASMKKTLIYIKPSPSLKELYEKDLIKYKELLTIVSPSLASELDKYIVKKFDLSIPPPRPRGAKINSYIEFLDLVREILVSMGFEEAKGPHVELEFWNFDALFQAQDHPAREIHDTFFLDTVYQGKVPKKILEKAREIHEKGWRYKWNPLKALKPVLRTQTTAVSVRSIYMRGEGEYRVFTIDRVFRPETLDAKHAMEFYQLDGIIVGKNINFKHLLAFFREFAAALGIKEIWFKPGYFPFTEPSVEGFIKHPDLGWVEVFPGGVFRPEVMEILGAPNVKAIAWGIGIDRLAMSILGLDDIRDLFSQDLGFLRKLPLPRLPYFIRKTSGRDVDIVDIPL